MFKGYRTYMTAFLLGLVQAASAMEWITPEATTTLTNLLIGGGFVFLRAGISNK